MALVQELTPGEWDYYFYEQVGEERTERRKGEMKGKKDFFKVDIRLIDYPGKENKLSKFFLFQLIVSQEVFLWDHTLIPSSITCPKDCPVSDKVSLVSLSCILITMESAFYIYSRPLTLVAREGSREGVPTLSRSRHLSHERKTF